MTIRGGNEEPARVGDYALLTKLGEGGMGIVHLAQGSDGRRVALKVLRPQVVGDEEARGRLAREVTSLTRVRSPWIAEMIDADPWAQVPYVVTRYVPGHSLHEHVVREGAVADSDLFWLAGCLAEGLAAVHAAGVLHRDVKPGNVLMEGRTPILIDFGLARVADDVRLTQTGWLLGTPGYLAPEILYGDEATSAADVHAWAATVAYAATGRAPYGRGPAMAVMDRTRRGQHDLSGIAEPMASVLAAALHPDPLERPLLRELLGWLRPLSTRPEDPAQPPPTTVFAGPAEIDDDFTLPLALAADLAPRSTPKSPPAPPAPVTPATVPEVASPRDPRAPRDAQAPLVPLPVAAPPPPPGTPGTKVLPTEIVPSVPVVAAQPAQPAQPVTAQGPPAPHPAPDAMARMEQDWDHANGFDPEDPFAPASKAPLSERLRLWTTIGIGAAGVGAGFAAAPWPATALVVLAVWLLRAGSLAASAVASRRRFRGTKWYDGLRLITTSPWHLVRAVTGTVVLVSWSAGIGLAAALVCYAIALDTSATMFVFGLTLGIALWTGPGASRFKRPISRVLVPACRRSLPWLFTCAGLLALAGALGVLVLGEGTNWLPWATGPFGL